MDDLLVYCLAVPDKYLLVVNAANTDKDFAWVKDKAASFKVKATNESDRYSQLALQGPLAEEILQPLTELDLSQMKSFHYAYGRVAGIDSLISRTNLYGRMALKSTAIGNTSYLEGNCSQRGAFGASAGRAGSQRYFKT